MELNNLQKIVAEISGYDHKNDYSGAKNDAYYECESRSDKLKFIIEYSDHADGIIPVSKDEAEKVFSVLECDGGQNEHYHAFEGLKNNLCSIELEAIALDFDKYCEFHGGKNLESEEEFYADKDIAGRIEYLKGAINC